MNDSVVSNPSSASPERMPAASAGESGCIPVTSSRRGVPIMNTAESSSQPAAKFTAIPAPIMTARFHQMRNEKCRRRSAPERPSSERFPSVMRSFSPAMRTNPPNGSQFTLYSVSPFFHANNRGGNPNPNSSTRNPNHFAAIKCPPSCARIRMESPKKTTRPIKSVIPIFP